jgi:hypothetical protein
MDWKLFLTAAVAAILRFRGNDLETALANKRIPPAKALARK